jgi:hypothetical protein
MSETPNPHTAIEWAELILAQRHITKDGLVAAITKIQKQAKEQAFIIAAVEVGEGMEIARREIMAKILIRTARKPEPK